MTVAAALALMVLPVGCGMGDRNTTSNGMNENGIYDGSNGRNALNGAGEVIDDAGDAIERGADRIQRGLDDLDDGMTDSSTTCGLSVLLSIMVLRKILQRKQQRIIPSAREASGF